MEIKKERKKERKKDRKKDDSSDAYSFNNQPLLPRSPTVPLLGTSWKGLISFLLERETRTDKYNFQYLCSEVCLICDMAICSPYLLSDILGLAFLCKHGYISFIFH